MSNIGNKTLITPQVAEQLEETSELAQELSKDPYNFAFTGITGKYNERKLKDALLKNKEVRR
ncbi:MAG: hypothetical protein J6V67_01225 [Campylobacter sp.]|uniref:hypothetical protein n=1 Tax=Campylobacter sp. TaxID=205 RepID=UPI001B24091D|nr:hypothetical protein [Campylobacter sp.]MBO7154496.1 hypothetical protein [Campylobacter sp.]